MHVHAPELGGVYCTYIVTCLMQNECVNDVLVAEVQSTCHFSECYSLAGLYRYVCMCVCDSTRVFSNKGPSLLIIAVESACDY